MSVEEQLEIVAATARAIQQQRDGGKYAGFDPRVSVDGGKRGLTRIRNRYEVRRRRNLREA